MPNLLLNSILISIKDFLFCWQLWLDVSLLVIQFKILNVEVSCIFGSEIHLVEIPSRFKTVFSNFTTLTSPSAFSF